MIAKVIMALFVDSHIEVISQCPWFKDQAILRRRNASPTRFDRTVIIPAPKDFGFW